LEAVRRRDFLIRVGTATGMLVGSFWGRSLAAASFAPLQANPQIAAYGRLLSPSEVEDLVSRGAVGGIYKRIAKSFRNFEVREGRRWGVRLEWHLGGKKLGNASWTAVHVTFPGATRDSMGIVLVGLFGPLSARAVAWVIDQSGAETVTLYALREKKESECKVKVDSKATLEVEEEIEVTCKGERTYVIERVQRALVQASSCVILKREAEALRKLVKGYGGDIRAYLKNQLKQMPAWEAWDALWKPDEIKLCGLNELLSILASP
jgi:hypothetical protein